MSKYSVDLELLVIHATRWLFSGFASLCRIGMASLQSHHS